MRYKELLKEDTINGITVIDLARFAEKGYAAAEEDEPVEDEFEEDEEDGFTDAEMLGEADFGLGSKYKKADDDEMQDFLGRMKTKMKTKLDPYTMPYVHASNIKIVDDGGVKYDLEDLKEKITRRPSSILSKNEKMKHSNGAATQYFNVGLPALRGLAVNEETGEFVVVDTCPGAGACKTFCYAKKGSYVMFKDTSMKQTQILNFLLNDPEGFAEVLKAEIRIAKMKNERGGKGKDAGEVKVAIRWHDAGDFFSPEYVAMAYDVAEAFPDNLFYAYTKIAAVANGVKPKNFIINFSAGSLSTQSKLVNIETTKHSQVVPSEMFSDLIARKGKTIIKDEKGRTQFRDDAALDEFKSRMAEKYGIDVDSIKTYDEMMEIPEGDEMWMNVIVTPGTGDVSATRKDVRGTYLLFH